MVTNNESKTRECPYCKEDILVDAIKCKHCSSSVSAEKPAHKGKCPFCKEDINPEAVKCYHCKSMLNSTMGAPTTPGCGCGKLREVSSQQAMLAPISPGITDSASACNTVCLWFCPRDRYGNPDLGCVLDCIFRCSVFNSSGGTVLR